MELLNACLKIILSLESLWDRLTYESNIYHFIIWFRIPKKYTDEIWLVFYENAFFLGFSRISLKLNGEVWIFWVQKSFVMGFKLKEIFFTLLSSPDYIITKFLGHALLIRSPYITVYFLSLWQPQARKLDGEAFANMRGYGSYTQPYRFELFIFILSPRGDILKNTSGSREHREIFNVG